MTLHTWGRPLTLHPHQLKEWDGQRIEASYLDHRDKRIKRQWLEPMQLIQRLLQHIPAQGVHTVRYYGLYAPAAKRRYEQALGVHGNLEGLKARRSLDLRTVLLCCKTCGAPAELVSRRRHGAPKGNSYIGSRRGLGASGYVQQDDAPYIANVPISDLSGLPP